MIVREHRRRDDRANNPRCEKKNDKNHDASSAEPTDDRSAARRRDADDEARDHERNHRHPNRVHEHRSGGFDDGDDRPRELRIGRAEEEPEADAGDEREQYASGEGHAPKLRPRACFPERTDKKARDVSYTSRAPRYPTRYESLGIAAVAGATARASARASTGSPRASACIARLAGRPRRSARATG